ncbi:hypothetical protein LOZ58_003182 [Ophidiomyces ophidiicola]|nr:hypothetical protein LOZ65_002521 [Ophidiomyces ophidiicola]KAI1940393.1 hypothetical protein LOZ66_001986 [Ophidiomyces ophidiicola]KAI1961329.1 hypothetical protein LOZ58_003182 [Ophidiomyces ophidiicola]
MNKNPLSSATSTSAALSSTSTSTSSTAAETPVHTPNTDVSPCQAPGCPSFPGGAVAAGFFPGLIAGLLLGLAFYFLQKRRANRTPPASSKPGPFRQRSDDNMILHISDPIPSSAQGSIRTDFLRHQGSSENSPKSRSIRARASTRVKSLFAPKLTITVPDASTMPITPPQQIYPRTQQTMESIRVYSPIQLNEGTARPSRNINETNSRPPTTFSQMMERVGFQNPRGSPRYQVGEPEQQQAQKRFYQNEHTLRPGI